MQVTYTVPAHPGVPFGSVFAASLVGQTGPFFGLGITGPVTGKVVRAEVTEDERALSITVDLPDDAPGFRATIGLDGM